MHIPDRPKPRVHPEQIVNNILVERRKDEEAQKRIDALLFEYIIRHPERLKKWLDQGTSRD